MQNAFLVNISLFGPKLGVKRYFSCIWAYKCLRRAKQYVKANEARRNQCTLRHFAEFRYSGSTYL